MIDYLALLLETQGREEETETPDWSVLGREKAMGQVRAVDKNEVLSAKVVSGGGAEVTAAAVISGTADVGEQERRAATPRFAKTLLRAMAGTSGDLTAAGSRAGGAAWLYQQVRRSRAQAGYSRPMSNVMPLMAPEFPPEVRSISPEGLDRIFRRDARRYDGEFTLF